MRKIYTTLFSLVAASSLTLSAQQLPNSDFQSWKTSCGSSDAMGDMRQRPGVEPTDWFGSSVNQKVGIEKREELVFNDNNTLKLVNKFVGVKIVFKEVGDEAPAYISLGTPWVYASSTISECDGGTYGGLNFTYRPDAIKAEVKRTDSNTENSHIIVYSWNGTFKSKIGKKGAPSSVRDDVDRAIIGTTTTESGSNGTLIASADYTFNTTDDANKVFIVPLDYKSELTPEKINVIISAGDYWTRDNIVAETTLYAYNVSLLYYSRLESLKVNGTDVAGFDPDKYEYTVKGAMPTDANAITAVCMGNSGSATADITLDAANNKAIINVTNKNINGTDIDGATSHTYTINFKSSYVESNAKAYNGSLQVDIEMMGIEQLQDGQTVYITPTGNNECTFSLYDFEFDMDGTMIEVGDIVLNNVTITTSGTTETYYGKATNMLLGAEGTPDSEKLNVDVTLNGTVDAEGNAIMNIEVLWHYIDGDYTMDVPINVTFNGKQDLSAIGGIEADNTDAKVEYYNLQGIRVAADNLTPGIYVRRQGTEVSKILIRK